MQVDSYLQVRSEADASKLNLPLHGKQLENYFFLNLEQTAVVSTRRLYGACLPPYINLSGVDGFHSCRTAAGADKQEVGAINEAKLSNGS